MTTSSLSSTLYPLTSHKRWLVTGGCGFIGTSLIKHLLSEGGHTIRILDNLTVGTRSDLSSVSDFQEVTLKDLSFNLYPLSSQPELVVGDIRDPEMCNTCCKDVDIIIHLAANTGVPNSVENPRLDMECNVMGTFNMLEAARINRLKRFVFASSGAPAGECEPPIHEELPSHPVSPYGASKLAGEGYCSAYAKTFGLETVALRFSNVYGPGSTHKSSVVAKFIKQALNGETLVIYGDGKQTRDFIYIDDLIEAIYKAATILSSLKSNLPLGGEIFQIATNRETTVAEMTEMLSANLKEKGISDFQVIHAEKRIGDVQRNFSDTTKADKRLGWKCENTLQQGLAKTVQYFLTISENLKTL
jgi:UDP-glucose 4-epimerase